MPDIFISYRRDDTSGYAGRLYDQISAHFGAEHVFMDVAGIGPGSDFAEVIEQKVGTCDALIALIGKNWLNLKDDQNRPRLGNPEDFVSVEVLAALKRNVEVIPALVGGAKMPQQRELPQSLQPLSRHQALEISDTHFTRDVQDLIAALEKGAGESPILVRKWFKPVLIATVLVLALIMAGIWSLQKGRRAKGPESHTVARSPAQQASAAPPVNPSQEVANADISGTWKAVLHKDGSTFETFLTFEVFGDKLFGKVIYPTGEAGILNGTISNGHFSFITKHTPDFSQEEATITVDGRISGDEIEIVTQDNSGFAKGVAHRVAQIGRPKVLTH
jgi:TIR domain